MVLRRFSELGENARDVLKKGYHYGHGLIKIGITSKSPRHFQHKSNIIFNTDKSKITGEIESLLTSRNYGTFGGKWKTDNKLAMTYSKDRIPFENTALVTQLIFTPNQNYPSITCGGEFEHERFSDSCLVSNDQNSESSIVNSLVVAFKNCLISNQLGYDPENGLVMNDWGLEYKYENLGLYLRTSSFFEEIGTSVFYKVNNSLSMALDVIRTSNGGSSKSMICCTGFRYKLDDSSILRSKINSDLQIGTSLSHRFNDRVSLSFSFNIDVTNVKKGNHKVGLAIELS